MIFRVWMDSLCFTALQPTRVTLVPSHGQLGLESTDAVYRLAQDGMQFHRHTQDVDAPLTSCPRGAPLTSGQRRYAVLSSYSGRDYPCTNVFYP